MLPSLTAAFLLGLLCGSYIPFFPVTVSAALASLAIALSLLEQARLVESRRALALYGALLGGVLYWTVAAPPLHFGRGDVGHREKRPVELVGRIVAPVQHGEGRQTMVIAFQDHGAESRMVRLVWREPDASLHYGDRVSFSARLHSPSGSLNPGGFDYAEYLDRQGIDFTATASGEGAVRLLEPGSEAWRWAAGNRIDRWRAAIRQAAVTTLDQPSLGIFLGIVIGERAYLQQDLQEWFLATGTVHLLSISGSHLGLVAVVAFWIVKRTVLSLPAAPLLEVSRVITPSRIAILLTWPVVALYAWLAGAELATIRSLVMITIALVALWLGHDRRLYHAIAAAALMIVLHDPRALFDISFQLSFLSVFMIIHAVSWWESRADGAVNVRRNLLRRGFRYSREAFLMSGAVTLATLPLVALYFNQVPWMGIVTNILAVPFTGGLLVPLGLLAAALTVITGADVLIMGTVLEHLLDVLVQGLRWCAGIPGGEWHIAAPSMPAILLFYGALMAVSLGSAPRRIRIAGAIAVVSTVCWWVSSPRLGPDGDRWRVSFLDVGQGDSAVVELPDGQTVLIDGGTRYERFDMGRGVVAPFLWNRGIDRLDHVVATHQQLDHVGGLIWVLRHIPVRRYWENGVERTERFAADLTAALNDGRIFRSTAVRGQELLRPGPCTLTVLNPSWEAGLERSTQRLDGASLNNQSIVLRLECGAQSVLFAADIEVDGLRRLGENGRRPVTVVKVPHHGARSSFDRDWIEQIRPQYAVISVGRANSYGHPVPDVVQAYAKGRTTVFRTDVDGAVWIDGRLSSPEVTVTRMRDRLLRPVVPGYCLWNCEQENWRRVWLQWRDRFV